MAKNYLLTYSEQLACELANKCLISHNEKYKAIRIGESDSVYCCGSVIGIVRQL